MITNKTSHGFRQVQWGLAAIGMHLVYTHTHTISINSASTRTLQHVQTFDVSEKTDLSAY